MTVLSHTLRPRPTSVLQQIRSSDEQAGSDPANPGAFERDVLSARLLRKSHSLIAFGVVVTRQRWSFAAEAESESVCLQVEPMKSSDDADPSRPTASALTEAAISKEGMQKGPPDPPSHGRAGSVSARRHRRPLCWSQSRTAPMCSALRSSGSQCPAVTPITVRSGQAARIGSPCRFPTMVQT